MDFDLALKFTRGGEFPNRRRFTTAAPEENPGSLGLTRIEHPDDKEEDAEYHFYWQTRMDEEHIVEQIEQDSEFVPRSEVRYFEHIYGSEPYLIESLGAGKEDFLSPSYESVQIENPKGETLIFDKKSGELNEFAIVMEQPAAERAIEFYHEVEDASYDEAWAVLRDASNKIEANPWGSPSKAWHSG